MRAIERDLLTRTPRRWDRGLLLALLSAVLVAPCARATLPTPPPAPARAGTMEVEPSEVHVDLLFDGATLRVRGRVPAGHEAAVLLAGPEAPLKLHRKGRVWGFLWMNTAEVRFDAVPSAYVLHTSVPLAQLGPPELLGRLGLGLDGLEARAATDDPGGERRATFRELIRLKRREGLFAVAEGSVHVGRGEGDRRQVSTDLFLPARTPAGEYRVSLLSFLGGEGAVVAEATATIRHTGLAAFTVRAARESGLLYGVVAVLVAIGAGMLTGFVFGSGSKRAH